MRPLSRAAYLDAAKEFDLLATGRMQQLEKKLLTLSLWRKVIISV